MKPTQGARRSAVLLRLHAALAEERAGIADMLEQRAAELLQHATQRGAEPPR